MGILLFTLTDEGERVCSPDFITEVMSQYGFLIWAVKTVTEEESVKIKDYLVPSLWKNESLYESDVNIRFLIIAYDLAISPPTFTQKNLYPGIDNSRLLLFSYHFQKVLSQHMAHTDIGDVLCSTSSDVASRDCLSQLWPTMLTNLDDVIKKHSNDIYSKHNVLKELTKVGCYARVYLIDYNGQRAVEKIYRPEYAAKFEREKTAYLELANTVEGIPKVLAIGEYSLIIPFIEEDFHFEPGGWSLVPVNSIFSIIKILQKIYEAGYAIIDCHSGNCLFGRNGTVWLIDFEFLYKYTSRPNHFSQSYDIAGIPEDFDGDAPPGKPNYLQHPWLYEFGVTPQFVLTHNTWRIRLHRGLFWATKIIPSYSYRKLRSGFRFSLALLNLLISKFIPPLKGLIHIRMRP